MKKSIRQLIGVLFILFGVFCLSIGVVGLVCGLASRDWLRTDGVITAASVYAQTGVSGPDSITPDTYGAKISYDYKVAGVTYTGTRVGFGDLVGSEKRAQAIVSHYQPGTTVSVFYSPKNPKSAVLERGVFGGTWIGFGVGIAMMTVGLWSFFKKSPDHYKPSPAQ